MLRHNSGFIALYFKYFCILDGSGSHVVQQCHNSMDQNKHGDASNAMIMARSSFQAPGGMALGGPSKRFFYVRPDRTSEAMRPKAVAHGASGEAERVADFKLVN